MTEPIQVGDRVTWRSRRMNDAGLYRRLGTVLKLNKYPGHSYAYVRPDKGHGHLQWIRLGRLTKVEATA